MRAVFVGFVPGAGATLFLGVAAVWSIAPDQVTHDTATTALAELVGVTVGFAAALELRSMHLEHVRRLRTRSFLTGLLAPLFAGAISILYPSASIPAVALLSIPAGAASVLLAALPLLRFRIRGKAEPQGQA